MKIFISSNVNVSPIKEYLRTFEIVLGEPTRYIVDLIDPASAAYDRSNDVIAILVDGDTLLGDRIYDISAASPEEEFLAALQTFVQSSAGKLVIGNTLTLRPSRYTTYADVIEETSFRNVELQYNARLLELAREHRNFLLLDMEAIVRKYGYDSLIAPNFWYAGRIRYNSKMLNAIGEHLQGIIGASLNQTKKALIVDLDNTLWGGIVGEQGIGGLALGEDGRGKCYRDLQKAIRGIKTIGVLLGICSRNNEQDAREVFEKHPMMSFRWDDFVVKRINWRSKSQNLKEIAEELNIGLDSIVFIDDSPRECELVREAVPEVSVPSLPNRPEEFVDWFYTDVVQKYFPRYRLTNEDRHKSAQYIAKAERRKVLRQLTTGEDLVRTLGIKLSYYHDDPMLIERAAQLTQKTNQFNLSTRRYSSVEIERFTKSERYSIIAMRYTDKFGDEGIVGLAILDFAESRLDTFLMSCRVLGREVEKDFLIKVEQLFRDRKCSDVHAMFIPTAKNDPIKNFFPQQGYEIESVGADGRVLMRKRVAECVR